MKKNKSFWASLTHAARGLIQAFRQERNIKIEAIIGLLACTAGILLDITKGEFLAVLLCCLLVLSLEYMNSALESIVDLASPDYHELAGKAKDFAAGAVLIAAVGAAVIGVIIFLPYLLRLIGS